MGDIYIIHYVLEAKVVLHEKIQVSILTEFIENEKREVDKQDCEQEGAKRLMERLKQEFPMLQICICANSAQSGTFFLYYCDVTIIHHSAKEELLCTTTILFLES